MKAIAPNSLGIYLSIPFCRSKCTYCNFASGVYPASDHTRYVHRLIEDLRKARVWSQKSGVELPRTVDSVYLGGGTPSLLEPELLERLFTALRSEFAMEADAEITVEVAPAQLAEATLQAMVAVGVNRVSLGVQSFVDQETRASGRLHTRASALETIDRLRASGIANLSVDLIAGLPGQTLSSWEESLEVLAGCELTHASVYMLEVDEDSRLGRELLAGGARYSASLVPSDEAITQMYLRAIERLSAVGLAQYEISNFGRDGFHSRHNLRYWQRRPYLGLGLDASSALFRGESLLRTTTTADLKAYLAGVGVAESECLDLDRQHEEAWFLGLRMNSGVNVGEIERIFGKARLAQAIHAVNRLTEDGLLTFDGVTVRLTSRGRLLSNDVFQEFLADSCAKESAI